MLTNQLKLLWESAKFPHSLLVNSQDVEADLLCVQSFINQIYKPYRDISYENNSDVITVQKEDGKFISIEQIRKLNKWINQTSGLADFKFIVILHADLLNISASNACLKMLEEPPLGTYFILISDKPQKLLITIRSRCHKINSYAKADINLDGYTKLLATLNANDDSFFTYSTTLKATEGAWNDFTQNIFYLLNRWLKFANKVCVDFSPEEYKCFKEARHKLDVNHKFDAINALIVDAELYNLDLQHAALLIFNNLKK